MRALAILLVAAWFVPACLGAAEGPVAPVSPAPPASPAAPDLRGIVLTDLAGKNLPLDSLLAKGPVVLNFWATWCGPCRAEMPNLEKVFKEVGSKGVSFAAISLDRRVSKESMETFLKGRGFTVPVYLDKDAVLAKLFKVTAIPATIVLRPTGEIFYSTKGYRPGDEVLLKKKVEELVAAAAKQAATNPD